MAQTATKLSVSVPEDLARVVRKRAGSRGLSSFVARALRHELEREQLGAWLAGMEADLGAVPSKVLAQARAAWRGR